MSANVIKYETIVVVDLMLLLLLLLLAAAFGLLRLLFQLELLLLEGRDVIGQACALDWPAGISNALKNS